jgi:His/Glu/Gln/Arg/opine family amino acid ABC transporter permease subunit
MASMSWENLSAWMPQLVLAALSTLRMAVLAYLLALAAGLFIALGRIARNRAISRAAGLYIEIMRGTPVLTQLFLLYFGLASVGIVLPAYMAAVIGLGLHYAAYMAEVYRAGILAVDAGQMEAALAIGLTRRLAMRLIVLPQAVRIVLPSMANYSVALLKETSVASLISAPDLMLRARDLSSEYFMPMELYLLAGAIYLVMTYPLAKGARYLELRMGKQGMAR